MRDAHRMKEKYDLSLDNRQIVSLVIGGIVVLGAVFVLGVVVGKKLSGSVETAQAPNLLAALDKKAEVPLTFQDELTKKTPSAAPLPEPEPQKSAQVPAEPAAAEAPAPAPEREPAVAEAPEPEPEREPEREPAPVPEKARVAEQAVAARTTEKDLSLQGAFARATRPAEAKTGGAWTLQLSASQSQDEADRFAARLRDRGYAPFIVKATVPGRGTWFRVRMGSFPTKDAAQRYLQDFKRETPMEAFVAASD